jgi:hypothetical protein
LPHTALYADPYVCVFQEKGINSLVLGGAWLGWHLAHIETPYHKNAVFCDPTDTPLLTLVSTEALLRFAELGANGTAPGFPKINLYTVYDVKLGGKGILP